MRTLSVLQQSPSRECRAHPHTAQEISLSDSFLSPREAVLQWRDALLDVGAFQVWCHFPPNCDLGWRTSLVSMFPSGKWLVWTFLLSFLVLEFQNVPLEAEGVIDNTLRNWSCVYIPVDFKILLEWLKHSIRSPVVLSHFSVFPVTFMPKGRKQVKPLLKKWAPHFAETM